MRIVLILGCFWYLYIATKISSPFSGVWQSKLLGILKAKLGTKFWKYLLKFSAISKSLVIRLPFSIRDIFSKLFIREETFYSFPKLFIIYCVFYVQIGIVCLLVFLINYRIYFFIVCFFVTFGSTFKEFFS